MFQQKYINIAKATIYFLISLFYTMKNTLLLISIIWVNLLSAQSICDDALNINSLPFFDTSVNTANADCDITGNYCNNSGQAGNDTIYEYYSNSNQNIDIILSNVIIQYNWLVAVYLIDTCPDVATSANCIASADGGEFTIMNQPIDSNKTYYIVVTNTILSNINSFTYDIEIRKHFQKDLGLTYFTEPRSDCDLGSELSLDVKNFGSDTIFGVNLLIQFNDYLHNDFYNDTFPPNYQKTYFYGKDYSTNDTFNIKAWINLPIDENNLNDTMHIIVHKLQTVNTFPYIQDFEDISQQEWVTEWTTWIFKSKSWNNPITSWEIGTPNNNIIDSAASGNNCWVTNLNNDCYSYEKSILLSPCFDFTSLSSPVIEFDIFKSLDSTASVYIEYTTEHNKNWNKIGEVGSGYNWYNTINGIDNDSWLGNSNGWIHASHRIAELAGEPHVIFRFIINNNSNTTCEGFAVDNIKIAEAPNNNIGISKIINPKNGCLIGNDSITAVITNYSPDSSHTNFIVKAFVDNILFSADTIHQNILPNDSLIYTFNNLYNFDSLKRYKIKVATYLSNDDNVTNDADSLFFYNFNSFNNFPYVNDFETDNGTWYSSGLNSSWEYGTPTDSVINSAASGFNVWATNLNGYHNQPEESYLTSSCFEISQLNNPIIKFNTNYDLYVDGAASSYVQLQYSYNNGLAWEILGNSNVNDWYNAGYSWTGKTNSWKPMQYKINELVMYNTIQFRFKLFALQEKTGFAFDDFTICDAPISNFNIDISGRNVTTTNTSTNADNYNWYLNDTLVSTEINPVIIVTQDTSRIMLVSENSCYTDTLTSIVYTTGINSIYNDEIMLYPSPVNNTLNIKFNKSATNTFITIFDATGRYIYSKKYFNLNKNISIDFSNYNKGIYFIYVKTNNSYFYQKIIK